MGLNVEHLLRTAATLEQALLALEKTPPTDEVMYDLYRNAGIKSFELSLETAGKLLRKALQLFGGNPRSVDSLVFNDVLRHSGKHGVLEQAAVERWLTRQPQQHRARLRRRLCKQHAGSAARLPLGRACYGGEVAGSV